MANLFDTVVATGLAALHNVASEAATYRRGADELTVNVTWGKPGLEEFAGVGTGTVHEDADALIEDYDDLIDQFGVPRVGDEIEQTGIVRRVLPMDGQSVYRWSGNARQVLRIHTKIVEEE